MAQVSGIFKQSQMQMFDLKALVSTLPRLGPWPVPLNLQFLRSVLSLRPLSEGLDEASPSGAGFSSPETEAAAR